MTNAAVNDLNSLLMNVSTANSNSKVRETENFKNAMQCAANQSNCKDASSQPDKISADYKKDTKNKGVDSKDVQSKLNSYSKRIKTTQEDVKTPEEMSEEDVKQLSEKVEELIGWIQEYVTDLLSISPEELQETLQELEMQPGDLLNVDNLKEFAMKVTDTEDQLQFITDEKLYQTVTDMKQAVMQEITQVTEEFDISPKELQDLLKQVKNNEVMQNPEIETVKNNVETVGNTLSQETESKLTEDDSVMQEKTSESIENEMQQTNGPKADEKKSDSQTHNQKSDDGVTKSMPMITSNAAQNSFIDATQELPLASPETQEIMRQITDYIKVNMKPQMTELQMQLQPENLGTMHIQLLSKNGHISAQITTENETVKAALETQLVTLKENFEQQGLKVEEVSVTIESHGFEDGNRQQSNQGSRDVNHAKKMQIRRINLDAIDEEQELTDEEQIAVDMMTVNGNTLDYTV